MDNLKKEISLIVFCLVSLLPGLALAHPIGGDGEAGILGLAICGPLMILETIIGLLIVYKKAGSKTQDTKIGLITVGIIVALLPLRLSCLDWLIIYESYNGFNDWYYCPKYFGVNYLCSLIVYVLFGGGLSWIVFFVKQRKRMAKKIVT